MLRPFIFVITLSVVYGFVGSKLSSVRVTQRHAQQQSLSSLKMVSPAALLASVPILYSTMSVNEYITHRWYQHTDFNKTKWMQRLAKFILRKKQLPTISGGGHVEHHAETYDDMTLKTDDARWMRRPAAQLLNADPFRGTAFTWSVYFLMCLQMMPFSFPPLLALGFNMTQSLVAIMVAVLGHTTVWNTLHPDMHGLPPVPLSHGPPSELFSVLRNTAYFKWIYENHEGHHVAGGQKNYNVCCPGTDHLLGTFMSKAEWEPMVKPRPIPAEPVLA